MEHNGPHSFSKSEADSSFISSEEGIRQTEVSHLSSWPMQVRPTTTDEPSRSRLRTKRWRDLEEGHEGERLDARDQYRGIPSARGQTDILVSACQRGEGDGGD